MAEATPRSIVKALVRGERPVRPLLLPLAFALASRIDNLAVCDFVRNPTKIVNALRQIRSTLKLEGVTSYFDSCLEVEALRGKINWMPEGPVLMASPQFADIDELRTRYLSGEQILNQGRVPVVAEVLRRLRTLLKDEPALMVGVTGPLKLASQLTVTSREAVAANEVIEFAADITAALAKHFVESGADVVFLRESSPGAADEKVWQWWRGLLDPIINVIRFYDALPVLLPDETVSVAPASRILDEHWECLTCLSMRVLVELGSRGATQSMGIALPATFFGSATGVKRPDIVQIREVMAQVKPAFVTTTDDLPANTDLRQVTNSLGEFRQTVLSAA
jgi:hypothetical protein